MKRKTKVATPEESVCFHAGVAKGILVQAARASVPAASSACDRSAMMS
jgi:hypothetical protein